MMASDRSTTKRSKKQEKFAGPRPLQRSRSIYLNPNSSQPHCLETCRRQSKAVFVAFSAIIRCQTQKLYAFEAVQTFITSRQKCKEARKEGDSYAEGYWENMG